jgi:hypothetical protein
MKKGQQVERLIWRPAAVQQSRGMYAMCYLCRECLFTGVRNSDFASRQPLDLRQAAFSKNFNDAGGFVDSAYKAAIAITDFSHGGFTSL